MMKKIIKFYAAQKEKSSLAPLVLGAIIGLIVGLLIGLIPAIPMGYSIGFFAFCFGFGFFMGNECPEGPGDSMDTHCTCCKCKRNRPMGLGPC